MNASDLVAFLNGSMSGDELHRTIEREVESWARRLGERGRSAAVILVGMRENFDLTPERAGKLLDAFIANELSDTSFSYVLDALLLEEKFRWTSIQARESMEHVLGSESPQKIDKRRAWRAKTELGQIGGGLMPQGH